ncbi:CidA/LrgA family protein [Actinomycetes bacterium NPDC127524]
MKWLCKVPQIIFISLFQAAGEILSGVLKLPIPRSIVGLLLLFLFLQFKWIKIEWVELGASLLITEMMLFFIPSAAGIIQYKSILGIQGIKIMLVIALSTLLVMIFTGGTAELLSKLRKDGKNGDSSSNC